MSGLNNMSRQSSNVSHYSQPSAPSRQDRESGDSQPTTSLYIVRPGIGNGYAVPLVPADELPLSVRLYGVPRSLTWEQTFGMQHVGTIPPSGRYFTQMRAGDHHPAIQMSSGVLHSRTNPFGDESTYLPPDYFAGQNRNMSTMNVVQPDTATNSNDHRSLSLREYVEGTRVNSAPQTIINTISEPPSQARFDPVANGSLGTTIPPSTRGLQVPLLPPSGKRPDPERKEFCTYWIRTGECDYIQQGCLYKHEMPDRATLAKIGFRQTPRWWLDKQNAAITIMERERAKSSATSNPEEWLKNISRRSSIDSDSSDEQPATISKSSSCVKQADAHAKTDLITTGPLRQMMAESSHADTVASMRSKAPERKSSLGNDLTFLAPLVPTQTGRMDNSHAATSSIKPTSRQKRPTAGPSKSASRPTVASNSKRVFVPQGELLQVPSISGPMRASPLSQKPSHSFDSDSSSTGSNSIDQQPGPSQRNLPIHSKPRTSKFTPLPAQEQKQHQQKTAIATKTTAAVTVEGDGGEGERADRAATTTQQGRLQIKSACRPRKPVLLI